MPIKYKIIQKGQPGVAGGGTKKYYASAVNDGEFTIDEMVKEIEKFSALSEPDIKGVIIALENVIQTQLSNSKVIRLEKLDSFYPTLSSEGEETADKVDHHSVKRLGINYRPGTRILSAMKDAGVKKVD